eukprot:scaffold2304_cov134-Isochrysis_galbana.AAC.2
MQSPPAQPQTPLPTPSYGGKPTYSGGKKDYHRTPPPTTYESQSASSPYPSAAPTLSRSVYPRQTGRTCTYPSNGQGLPADSGATEWNQELYLQIFTPRNRWRCESPRLSSLSSLFSASPLLRFSRLACLSRIARPSYCREAWPLHNRPAPGRDPAHTK